MHQETLSTIPQEEATFSWNSTPEHQFHPRLSSNFLKTSAQRLALISRHYVKVLNQRMEVKHLVTLVLNSIELLKACTFKVEILLKLTVSTYLFKFLTQNLTFLGSNNGGGFSLYAGEFADESFQIKHSEPGLIGMCKRGGVPNSNEC